MTAGHLDDLAGSVAAGQFDAAAQGSGWRGIAQTANHNHEVLLADSLADSISSGLLLSDCKAADYCTRQQQMLDFSSRAECLRHPHHSIGRRRYRLGTVDTLRCIEGGEKTSD